jgi:hypothetical protein
MFGSSGASTRSPSVPTTAKAPLRPSISSRAVQLLDRTGRRRPSGAVDGSGGDRLGGGGDLLGLGLVETDWGGARAPQARLPYPHESGAKLEVWK